MKAILVSIKPQWVAKILNGEKTIEIRKRFPKDYVGWVYIYCTKDSQHPVAPFHFKEGWFYKEYNDNTYYAQGCSSYMGDDINGKVVARFWCDKVEEISHTYLVNTRSYFISSCLTANQFSKECCLEQWELDQYLQGKNGYAIHISNLEIFKSPKKLSKFKRPKWSKCGVKGKDGFYQCKNCPYGNSKTLTCEYDKPIKAPQNYCYVEVEK